MKKGLLILPLVATFALSGCDFLDGLFGPTEVTVEKVIIEDDFANIEVGGTFQIKAHVSPKDAKQDLTYKCADSEIASVSKTGLIRGLSVGDTTIEVASAQDKSKFAVLDLCVADQEVPPSPPTYTVVFDANGGVGEMENDEVIGSSYTTPECTFTYEGYIFNKWALNHPDGPKYSVGYVINNIETDITLYATWKDNTTPPDPGDDKNHGFYGGLVDDGDFVGYEFSKSKTEIEKPSSGLGDINIFAFNDFHGAVLPNEGTDYGEEAGLKLIANFYKNKSAEQNTLILDQGDTWQGSFESNYQHGAIVQDVFNYAGVSLRTVGNHDFDWGLNHLKSTNNREIDGQYIPCLGANVYDYSGGVAGTTQQSDYGKEYATFVLDNGIKVGVVGVIGSDQITSICSQLVDTICFTDHIAKIKELSDYLRVEKECDVVIASVHEGSTNLLNLGLTDVSPVSNHRYIDLALGGHKHYKNEETENGVKFVQWTANGAVTGSVSLKYNFATGQLVDSNTSVNPYYPNYYKAYYSNIDPTIDSMVDDYIESIETVGDEVLSTHFSGSFTTSGLARLMTEAIYSRVSQTVNNLDFACCNYARDSFEGENFTYRDLYRCFPFDNQIILLDVYKSYSCSQIRWNFGYRGDTSVNPSYGGTYKCAVIDYVATHQNANRQYDKFEEAGESYTVFNDTLGDAPTYRDILYAYLKANASKTFSASYYESQGEHYVG